ncbi:DUF4038 domain-containing protein [Nibricoccus sp. IMCC34717]|uniref:apiosidase-like domain-containing protein n=1 Tax=Nibricoccus sp. IMCC34717 TaxID=3034021 RepID=UPI00384F89C1
MRLSLPLLAFASLFTCSAACGQTLPPLEVAPGGHHLQTTGGKSFFWLGDTGWKIIQSATREECMFYLDTRARQGFTLIQTMLLAENESVTVPNSQGDLAFVDGDPLRPNERFFEHAHWVINEAAKRGLYVALVPAWGDKLTAPWGTGPRIFRNDNLPVARAYGEYVGRKFRDCSNIVWLVGGDRPVKLKGLQNDFLQRLGKEAGFGPDQDWTPIWTAMVEGLQAGLGRDPLTLYHPQGGEFSSSQQLQGVGWLDMNGMQSGHGGGFDQPVWEWIARDFALTPAKPTLDIEPNYEDCPYNPWPSWDPSTGYFTDHDVRKQCYRSVLAGGAGVTYGHHAVWQLAGKGREPVLFVQQGWVQALDRPGGRQLVHLRTLLEKFPIADRVPDQTMVVAQPGADRRLQCVAGRDRSGRWALVYVPDHDLTVTVDLGVLSGPRVQVGWYDTRSGFTYPAEVRVGGGRMAFTSPNHGPDWVLVLQSVP